MNLAFLLPLCTLFPLLLCGLAVLKSGRDRILSLLPLAAAPALLMAVMLPVDTRFSIPGLVLGAQFHLDDLGRVFLVFTAFGWLTAALFATRYFAGHERRAGFAVPFLLAMAGNFLLPVAADAVTFYSGFALMSFASWGLVVFDRSPSALRAGKIYLILVVAGELMVFPALVQGVHLAGSTDLAVLRGPGGLAGAPVGVWFLLLIGFGIKAGLAPLHVWLPLAHPAAPTPASAVLSGCMIKAGLLGWLRVLPLGETAMPSLALTASILGCVTLIGAQGVGLTQTHAKALLAYSSISKMGTILLVLTPAMRDPALAPACVLAATVYALFHSLHKGALFLGVAVTPGLTSPIARRLGAVVLILLAASFAGLPWLSGAVAKIPFKKPFYGLEGWPLVWSVSGFLSLLLTARFAILTWPGSDRGHPPKRGTFSLWLCTALAALLFPLLLAPLGLKVDLQAAYGFKALAKEAVATAGALILLGLWLKFRWPLQVRIPPGDLLSLGAGWKLPARAPRQAKPEKRSAKRAGKSDWPERVEEAFASGAGGLVFILVTLGLLALLWEGVA